MRVLSSGESPNGAGTTGGIEKKPQFSILNQPVSVDEGEVWISNGNSMDENYPGIVFYVYDYTGTPGTYTEITSNPAFGGLEPIPGNYTAKVRAAWSFGQSDEYMLNIQVNPFTLNVNNMFGGLAGLQGTYDFASQTSDGYIGVVGAVVDNGGTYEVDRDGSLSPESLNSIMMYDFTAQRLVAFRVNSGGSIGGVYYWIGVTGIEQDTVLDSGSNFISNSSQRVAAENSSVQELRVPFGGYYNGGLGARKCLSITPDGNEFDTFGSRNADWSYVFQLKDDWIGSGTACQMLSPVGEEYFVNAIVGFGIGSSPYEYIHYGDSDSGPFNTSTNGASWNISTNDWVIGNVGDLVVVTYDGVGTGTYKVYVNGTLIFSSTSVDTYMSNDTTPSELRFGDSSGSNALSFPDNYNELGSWYSRLEYLGVAVGTAFTQTQVDELTMNKDDLTLSANYSSITTLGTFTDNGIENTKGNLTYSRLDVSF